MFLPPGGEFNLVNHPFEWHFRPFSHIMAKDVQNWRGPIHGKHWQLQKLSDRVKIFDESYELGLT